MNQSNLKDKQSMAAISLMAAMADGKINDKERALVNSTLAGLSDDERSEVYQRVALRQTSIDSEVAHLAARGRRTEALKLARQICEADEGVNQKEQEFLRRLEALYPSSIDDERWADAIPPWALEFSARAAAIRLLDHPMALLWMTTLKIQMARSLRQKSSRYSGLDARQEISMISRLILLPDATLTNQLRQSGVGVRAESPEFAFASMAALCHLFGLFYLHGEKPKAGQIRVAFRNRYTMALAEYPRHRELVERWLREGEPFSIAVKEL